MSLFENIVKSALGAAANATQTEGQTSSLVTGALGMLENMGGVEGLVNKFQQSGLGDLAASWVGSGVNQTISADQLHNVLGSQQIAALAEQAGIPASQGAGVLANLLPELVNKLTPNGELPDASQLGTLGKVLLGGAAAAAATAAAAAFFSKDDASSPAAADATSVEPADSASTVEVSEPTNHAANTYTVSSGDTLSRIARHFYGDSNQWSRIYEANRDTLNNPDLITPGQVLRIP